MRSPVVRIRATRNSRKTQKFSCRGSEDKAGQRLGAAPFDGIELQIHPDFQDRVNSFFDPDNRRPALFQLSDRSMRYSLRTGQLQMRVHPSPELDRFVQTATAFDAVHRFSAAIASDDSDLSAEALEAVAAKLIAIPAFSPTGAPSGWGRTWEPYGYARPLFGAGLLALTVPVLIVARRVA